jgi:hypothetical protein
MLYQNNQVREQPELPWQIYGERFPPQRRLLMHESL